MTPDDYECRACHHAMYVPGGMDPLEEDVRFCDSCAIDEIERLQAIESEYNTCREIVVEVERRESEMARQYREQRDRLQSIVDILTDGAEWCGWQTVDVAINVNLWNLPHCDGRNKATLLDAAEKAMKQP